MVRRCAGWAVLLGCFAATSLGATPAAGPVSPAGTSSVPPMGPAMSAEELRNEIVGDYMGSKWDDLEKVMHDRVREIGALPREMAGDVTTVKNALAEVRPAWWAGVKAGRKAIIHPSLWGRNFTATYDPDIKSGMQLSMMNDVATLTVNWSATDMDSVKPGEHGFSKGDLNDVGVFATLGGIDSWRMLPPAQEALTESGKLALARYIDFRGNLAAVGYTNPGGRRWAVWLFLDSYNANFEKLQTRMAREALGAFAMGEFLTHPEVYKSIELPKTLAAENAEETLARWLTGFLERHAWTLNEDAALRYAVKGFANANGAKVYTTGLMVLPNGLTMAMDPEADKALRVKRDAWVKEKFDKVTGGK